MPAEIAFYILCTAIFIAGILWMMKEILNGD